MKKEITIKLTQTGPNAGPFSVTDNFNNVVAENVSRKDLIKGKKYRYKSPSHVDDIEFEDEYGDIDSDPMYQFKGKDTGYSLNPKAIEDFIEDYDEEMMESISLSQLFKYCEYKSHTWTLHEISYC